MPLAEAKALAGPQASIHFESYDPRADRAALRQLALACQQFGPYAALEEADPPECLLVDVTGCGPIFDGEARLAEAALQALRQRGYVARAAVADTIGAAWAAVHGGDVNIVPPGAHPEALRSLPVETLRLPRATLELLYSLDLRRIEQLLELPRAELPARFGPEVVKRLDQALGRRPELLTPEKDDAPIEASWELDYPSGERRVLEKVLEHLLAQVLEKLQPRGLGVQRLLATLRITSTEPVYLQVGLLQPSASAGHLLELMRLQSERLQLAAEVKAVALRVLQAVPLEFRQGQIFADDVQQQQREQFPALVERLSHRLGEKAVLRPRLWPDAQPELAWRYEPWLRQQIRNPKIEIRNKSEARSTKSKTKSSANESFRISNFEFVSDFGFRISDLRMTRPPCLKTRPIAVPVMSVVPEGPPVRFDWQNARHVIAHWWGPERIETGWWRGRDVRRDYYLVETTTGARFWLFRALEERTWFLHGND
jgi:protein ImuB